MTPPKEPSTEERILRWEFIRDNYIPKFAESSRDAINAEIRRLRGKKE